MIERTPILNALTHLILIVGLVLVLLPFAIVLAAATKDIQGVNQVPMSLMPGGHLIDNLAAAWDHAEFGPKLLNSLIVAVGVTVGKIVLAALTAFSIVFFRYRARMLVFWLIFTTLMLPLEVRIVPTYSIAANALSPFQSILAAIGLQVDLQWNLLNSYTGLILPLIATATGTFLYRQFFLTVPDELLEASKMDGAGAMRFFAEILMPLSRTNMLALAAILFVYSWNQYLWPLLVTTDQSFSTAVVELKRLIPTNQGGLPEWNIAMAGTLIVMIPPLLVVALMQRWFVRGLIATEK
ncbi:sn-glycerol-3-phosphate ABC transporter permease UgpE [Inquilinus limosus]|uniref:sn-glycerol-3-phosphate transport system permease protein UgpE n=1 Tax=Inquilinus limosus MP06 TaxID=1398085 RepID=A0A0A0D9T4_9PROT|nr:sn-glycerol-3-phosphate ABC transporter permease UgpE [Inquilinus limosus]KGM33737.1 ABC transporter permease [Inquilinus limosus MP06]